MKKILLSLLAAVGLPLAAEAQALESIELDNGLTVQVEDAYAVVVGFNSNCPDTLNISRFVTIDGEEYYVNRLDVNPEATKPSALTNIKIHHGALAFQNLPSWFCDVPIVTDFQIDQFNLINMMTSGSSNISLTDFPLMSKDNSQVRGSLALNLEGNVEDGFTEYFMISNLNTDYYMSGGSVSNRSLYVPESVNGVPIKGIAQDVQTSVPSFPEAVSYIDLDFDITHDHTFFIPTALTDTVLCRNMESARIFIEDNKYIYDGKVNFRDDEGRVFFFSKESTVAQFVGYMGEAEEVTVPLYADEDNQCKVEWFDPMYGNNHHFFYAPSVKKLHFEDPLIMTSFQNVMYITRDAWAPKSSFPNLEELEFAYVFDLDGIVTVASRFRSLKYIKISYQMFEDQSGSGFVFTKEYEGNYFFAVIQGYNGEAYDRVEIPSTLSDGSDSFPVGGFSSFMPTKEDVSRCYVASLYFAEDWSRTSIEGVFIDPGVLNEAGVLALGPLPATIEMDGEEEVGQTFYASNEDYSHRAPRLHEDDNVLVSFSTETENSNAFIVAVACGAKVATFGKSYALSGESQPTRIELQKAAPDLEEIRLDCMLKEDVILNYVSNGYLSNLKKIAISNIDSYKVVKANAGMYEEKDITVELLRFTTDDGFVLEVSESYSAENPAFDVVDYIGESPSAVLLGEYEFGSQTAVPVKISLDSQSETASNLTFLSLPTSVSAVSTITPGLTLSIPKFVVIEEEALADIKVALVPADLLGRFRDTYESNYAVFVDADALVTDNDNVAYDAETNTLEVDLTASEESADILQDVVAAINAGAANTENVIIRLSEDVEAAEWTSVGTAEAPFTGTFDGAGHVISLPEGTAEAVEALAAVFGNVGEEGKVQNVAIEAAVVAAASEFCQSEDGKSFVKGILADVNMGTLSDVFFCGPAYYDATKFPSGADVIFALVGDNRGDMDHCAAYVTTVPDEDDEAEGDSGNKALALNQNTVGTSTGSGNNSSAHSVSKCCMNRSSKIVNKRLAVTDPISGQDFDEEEQMKDIRMYTNDAWATGEPAYWFNFTGRGYTGDFTGRYSFRNNMPVLQRSVSNPNPTVKMAYAQDGSDVDVKVSARRFANVGDEIVISYDVAPDDITGCTIVGTIGDTETRVIVPRAKGNKGVSTITLVYSAPSAVGSVAEAEPSVVAEGMTIAIRGAEGKHVVVTSLRGEAVADADVTTPSYRLTMPVAGLYVVSIDGKATKVVVR